MEYRTAIVDECGDIIAWCSDLSEYKIMDMLDEHPEWRRVCIEW